MKRSLLLFGLLLTSGCSTMSNTDKGLLTGGALGGGAGALVGSAVGRPGAGAAIGAGLGAITGALTGSAIDQAEVRAEDRAVQRATATQVVQAGPSPSLEEVVGMAQQHISDTVIVNAIRQSPAPYALAPNQIVWLKQQGVSDAVITAMQAHAAPQVYAPPPVVYAPPPQRVIIYERRPPPPPVGIGFHYRSRW
ncbi:MAG: DUF1269 domain-containing protein [Gemmataceae bacterium]|nr:DUF1269 domain-containing protein [Gemmataceae bacterium]